MLIQTFIFIKRLYSLFTSKPVRIYPYMAWFFIKGVKRSGFWIVKNKYYELEKN